MGCSKLHKSRSGKKHKSKSKHHKEKKVRTSSSHHHANSFHVLDSEEELFSGYDNLIELSEDNDDKQSNNRFLVLQDNHGDQDIFERNGNDIAEVISNDELDTNDFSEDPPILLVKKNDLEGNHDFIAFSASSEDEMKVEHKKTIFSLANSSEEDSSDSERSHNDHFPWLLNHDHSKQKEVADWLTREIRDFTAYISPSKDEIKLRNKTISAIKAAVQELWPDADLLVFGSYATDLYLPGSDIDCVINSQRGDKENRNSLYILASHLRQTNLATRVEVIAKARVPIIKFIEPRSQIHIDVSFERTNGVEAAKLIREWLDDTPGLRELVLIIKQFLATRRLNNVHTGGLGGFSIICLVYCFLKMHPRVITHEINELDNLGVLLIEFFELYGKNFAYDDVAISLSDGRASYLPKTDFKQLNPSRSSFALAIQDPGDPFNNISRGSFNIASIKKAFASSFELLTSKCFEMDEATFKDRVGESILGNVIKYKGETRNFRDERSLIKNHAIVENEHYHAKRSRISQSNDFLDPTSDSEVDLKSEEGMYHLDEPPKKKQPKKNKKKEKAINPAKLIAKKTTKSKQESNNRITNKEITSKTSVSNFMGVADNVDEDDKPDITDAKISVSATNLIDNMEDFMSDTEISRGSKELLMSEKSNIKKVTVDAQTRRNFWLSKGQSMSTTTVGN